MLKKKQKKNLLQNLQNDERMAELAELTKENSEMTARIDQLEVKSEEKVKKKFLKKYFHAKKISHTWKMLNKLFFFYPFSLLLWANE